MDNLGPGRRGEEGLGDVLSLESDDLLRLREPRPAERETLTRLRHKHHALARALANGLSQTEAALVSGFAPGHVTILLGDPTFSELVRFYEAEAGRAFNAIQEGLVGVTMGSIEEIGLRLDEEPEKISMSQLIEIAKLGADRTGNGPSTTQQVNINVGLADRMAQAQKRLEARRADGPIITYSEAHKE